MTQTTIKGFSVRVAMMLLMMLLTATTAWAFKAETTSYAISYSSNQFLITTGSTVTDSWTASTLQSQIYWKENESHQLAGMTIRPNQNVFYVSNSMHTTLNTSTTFTFTAPSTIAITSVVFKNGSNVVSGTNTASGSSYTVTLASGTSFTGFDVTYGTISGWCGTNATWSLSGTNYTVLTISGSGAMNDYGHDNASIWHTNAPWGYDLTSVTIGNDITSIGQYAFIGCQQLSSVTIGTGVTTLGAYAFNHCDALTQVTLPASVASIGDQCFRNSANLQRVNIQRTDGLVTLGDKVFNGCNNLQYIVAPTPTLALQYKDATNWNASKDKLRVKFGGYLFSVTNEGGADAYAITDETDLRNLASVLNNNSEGIANGKTFRQTGDITLSNADFEPIGYNDYHYFTGTYDGGGDYTISGLNVGDQSNRNYYGLFGYVKNGTVKNVRLLSPTVSAYGSGKNLGSLIGRTNNATVRNCVVFDPHYGTSGLYNGAIIGSNSSSTLENLYFYGGNFNNAVGNGSYIEASRVRKVIIGSGITSVTPAATDIANGFVHNNDRYYREGLELTFTTNLSEQTGYHITYKAISNAGEKTLTGNTYIVNSTDGDVTLTAVYTYTVHFDKNHPDATGTMADQAFTYGTPQNLTANAFTRMGYTFVGWATSPNGSVVYSDQQSVSNLTVTNATTTLYAKWTPTNYPITYHLNDGTLDTDKYSYTIESPDITLDTPTRTGYTFGGWYTNSNLTGTAVKTIAHGSTGDKQLWAKWTPVTYTITYNLNGGTLDTDKNSYTIESPDIILDTPTREGYTFGGWYTNANLTGNAVTTIAHGSTENKEFWAKWTLTDYTITYHLNGGTLDTDKNSYTFESPDITLDEPTRIGCTFLGWYDNAGLTGTAVTTITHGSTGNKQLWAKWDDDNNAGSQEHPYIITTAADLDQIAALVNAGNEFSGKYFKLGADITYDHDTAWNDANCTENNYTAIGGYFDGQDRYFKGHFDGDGHTISGIRIYKDGNDLTDGYQGLFGQTDDADIRGITLSDARITGSERTGGIVGFARNSTVSDCHVAADVAIHAVQYEAMYHGGIVGHNYGYGGAVNECTSAATLTKNGNNNIVCGGIAGKNIYGILHNNLAIGVAVPAASYDLCGTICGHNDEEGILDNNYYHACTVAGTANATGVGCGKADVIIKNGAVPGIILYDHSSRTDINSYILTTVGNIAVPRVALAGRTLYKDGAWNTLCLPFDVTIADSPLAGDGVDVRTLDNTDFSNGTLTLDFTDKDAVTTLKAGKPYLVRWDKPDNYVAYDGTNAAECSDLVSPIFNGVTVSTATANVETDCVDFIGILSPTVIYESGAEKTNLYMGADNKLYYPTVEGFRLNACRGYFKLKGVTVNGNGNGVRSFNINFGDDATGIVEMRDEKGEMRNGHEYEDGGWYTVDGRRLDGKPAQKGLYIHGGRKVVIK